jgi:hypothetical protein
LAKRPVFIRKAKLARCLRSSQHLFDQEATMYDQRFFASKLGLSALVSITAMVSFNVYALAQQPAQAADMPPVPVQSAELA